MSVNMDNVEDTGDVDYSDFEHEAITLRYVNGETGTKKLTANHNPLASQGGLRPNQMAELVALDMSPSLIQETAPNDTDTFVAQVRGTVGINLGGAEDDISEITGGTEETDNIIDNGGDDPVAPADKLFAKDGVEKLVPFFQSGIGSTQYFRSFRDPALTNRGPVLDADDEISIVTTTVSAGGGELETDIPVRLYYDIFETDDARSAFAVPR